MKAGISTIKQKRIFNLTQSWVNGEITTYHVMKVARVEHRTAEKYLKRFAAQIDIKSDEITNKIVTKQLKPQSFVQGLTLSFMRLIHGKK